jgi:hypothetical protein
MSQRAVTVLYSSGCLRGVGLKPEGRAAILANASGAVIGRVLSAVTRDRFLIRTLVRARLDKVLDAALMSSNSEAQKKELSAFFSFFATFNLIRPVTSVADLCDGAPLFEVLTLVYIPQLPPSQNCLLIDPLAMPITFARPRVRPCNRQTTGFCVSAR